MLVISRHVGEKILIDGPCVLEVVRIGPGVVRLGITAGSDVQIVREELANGWTGRKELGSAAPIRFVGGGPLDPDLPYLAIGEAAGGEDEDGEIVVSNSE